MDHFIMSGMGSNISFPRGAETVQIARMGKGIMRFLPSGEVVYDDLDTDDIVKIFWQCAVMDDKHLRPSITISTRNETDTGGAQITLHRSGDVTGEQHTPDPRALRLWTRIAAAWPK